MREYKSMAHMSSLGQIWLIRHGETEWSASGKHTGRTDIGLTEEGVRRAEAISRRLAGHRFSRVLSSPLKRAIETCRLAGYGDVVQIDPDLAEWDYGVFEGRTTTEIRAERPDWTIWNTEIPGGESLDDVAARAYRVIERLAAENGDVAIFSHGHLLRILAVCWLGLPPDSGRLFALDTGAISILGHERTTRVIRLWNETSR